MFVRNVVYTFSLVNTVNAFKLCFITESQVHRQLLLAALSKKKKKKDGSSSLSFYSPMVSGFVALCWII